MRPKRPHSRSQLAGRANCSEVVASYREVPAPGIFRAPRSQSTRPHIWRGGRFHSRPSYFHDAPHEIVPTPERAESVRSKRGFREDAGLGADCPCRLPAKRIGKNSLVLSISAASFRQIRQFRIASQASTKSSLNRTAQSGQAKSSGRDSNLCPACNPREYRPESSSY